MKTAASSVQFDGEQLKAWFRLIVANRGGVYSPSVRANDIISKGDQIGTIDGEPVFATFGGRVAEVLADDGHRVTALKPLFSVESSEFY